MTTTAILLAAGRSTRMGRSKPLLPWDGRPLVAFQVAQLHEAGIDDVVVVTGHEAAAVEEAVRQRGQTGARTVHNPAYEQGRAGSVRIGALAVQEHSDVVVLNVDQPRPVPLIRAVLAADRGDAAIIVPTYGERRGHPALFAARLLPALRGVTEETEGLRGVMRAHAAEVRTIAVDDARVLMDLNTPAAYAEALRAFGLAPA